MVIPRTYGRMGNFLFQAATAIAYAKKHNLPFTMPSQVTPGKSPKMNPIYLGHLINPNYNPDLPVRVVAEKTHAYHELPFEESWRGHNIMLDGYWQTEKYFLHMRQEILDLFGFRWEMRPGVVGVHVRRGDYLRLPKKHPAVPSSWITSAMEKFPGKQFLFFSDDLDWCERVFGKRKDCQFFRGADEVADLIEMSCCEDNICSASTFSWWGAWLNRNPAKRIYMPKLWFVPGWGGLEVKDIVPEEWTRL